MKKIIFLIATLLITASLVAVPIPNLKLMPYSGLNLSIAGQNVVNYMEQGGARWVIGGSLDVASGGDLDIESGGALKIAGTAITATAAQFNYLAGVTAGTATASKAVVLSAAKAIATITTATITNANITAVNATNIDVGLTGGGGGTLDLWPTGPTLGKLTLVGADSAGDTVTTITNASQAGTRTYTIPDAGASANFVLSTGTSTGIAKTSTELNQIVLTIMVPDVSTASSTWIVAPMAGNITKFYTVINGAIATADAVLTLEIAGTPVTDGVITIANAGSAAGDVDVVSPTAARAITAGAAIEIVNAGASTNTIIAWVTLVIDIT